MKTLPRLLGASSIAVVLIVSFSTVSWATPCQRPDNGGGTVDLPPAGCDYVGEEPWQIVDGFPAGTRIDIDVTFSNYVAIVAGPGGALGGESEQFQLSVQLEMSGVGLLAGFNRTIFVFSGAETHSAPRTPGAAVQSFATDWFSLQGQLFGDPDFDFVQIVAGANFGLPSPGQTTLTRLGPPGSDFNVDSFFDVEYTITFQGAPGSILEGFSGVTTSGSTPGVDSVIMRTGEPAGGCGASPAVGCLSPGKSVALVKDKAPAGSSAKDKVLWKFLKGPALSQADFGDPVIGGTSYDICIYDTAGLVTSMQVPTGGVCAGDPCWKAVGTKGWKYKDKNKSNDGVQILLLKGGDPGKSKIILKAKDGNTDVPGLPLDDSTSVTVQLLRNDSSDCWESVLPGPGIKNDSTQFKDKAP